MALQKSIVYSNGVTANYHKIYSMDMITRERKVKAEDNSISKEQFMETEINLRSYLSKDVRDKGVNNFVRNKRYTFELTPEEADGNVREVLYGKIKELDEFADAVDC